MAVVAAWCCLGAACTLQPALLSSPDTHHGGQGSSSCPHPSQLQPSPGTFLPASLSRSLGTAPLALAAKPGLSPKTWPRGALPCEALFDPSCPCSYLTVQLAPGQGAP